MNCLSNLECASGTAGPRLSAGRPAWLDDQLRNRLWAMTFLQAAAREGDAAERDGLRRRAAELLLPRKRVDRTA